MMRHLRPVRSVLCSSCEVGFAPRTATRAGPRFSWPHSQKPYPQRATQQARWQSTRRNEPLRSSIALRSFFAVAALGGAIFYFTHSGTSDGGILNETTFTPYTITAREAISPSTFVFTISPKTPQSAVPYLSSDSAEWRYPLWSVEFKQPEVQIARHYTPLPPQDGDDPSDGTLRFYVRAIDDGEMSNYLSRLRQGQAVWLRGPHRGFDILGRLGSRNHIVVLAGGTGVVPGMQAAEAVLGARDNTTVKILWAVRKREELQHAAPPARSSWWSDPEPTEVTKGLESPSAVGRQLEKMKQRFGDRLQIHVTVDEEKSAFSSKFLADALRPVGDEQQEQTSVKGDCRLHSQRLHQTTSEFESQTPECVCDGQGKNILLVSGPDGFITHYTGPKVWLGGSHTQGPVGGITRQVQTQDPRVEDEWLVLKL